MNKFIVGFIAVFILGANQAYANLVCANGSLSPDQMIAHGADAQKTIDVASVNDCEIKLVPWFYDNQSNVKQNPFSAFWPGSEKDETLPSGIKLGKYTNAKGEVIVTIKKADLDYVNVIVANPTAADPTNTDFYKCDQE